MKTTRYVEPADYFPKEIRKKNKIGEYAEQDKAQKQSGAKSSGSVKKQKNTAN